uniref:Putative rna polymerase i transcription factor subunit spp27 n=1 Tax=Tabanus bromius TaxID=304241 RepID=A0A0K8TKD0_TABBR
MADISTEQLKELIDEILKNADLTTTTAKAVRQQLQKQLNCDLLSRKKEIDNLVMDFVNNYHKSEEEDGEEEASAESEEEEEKPKKASKRSAASPKSKSAKKKKKAGSDEDDDDDGSDEDYVSKERSAKKTKKTRAPAKGGKGRGTGFTRPCSLSPDLAAIVGSDSLPRHEVVKKVWSIIKERNLYDPKNKQFAVCDPELMKVIGVKRFRIFGMLKYLRPHFVG